jgi:hypothetical protein
MIAHELLGLYKQPFKIMKLNHVNLVIPNVGNAIGATNHEKVANNISWAFSRSPSSFIFFHIFLN